MYKLVDTKLYTMYFVSYSGCFKGNLETDFRTSCCGSVQLHYTYQKYIKAGRETREWKNQGRRNLIYVIHPHNLQFTLSQKY